MEKEQRWVLRSFDMLGRFYNVFQSIDPMYEAEVFFYGICNGDLEFDVDRSTGTSETNIRDPKNELTTSSAKQVQREGRLWMLMIGHATVRVDTASCEQ